MTYEFLPGLVSYAIASSITPGPNNLMLLASGANYGFRRTIPHMMGISIGHMIMVILVGLGLVQVFEAFPVLHTILTVVSVAYLLYLAWRIYNAGQPKRAEAGARPMTFLEAALFQWVNPKAWAMALTAVTVYLPTQSVTAVLLVGLIFSCVNFPSVCVWTVFGQGVAEFLTDARRLWWFNTTMAVLLVASLIFVL